MGVSDIEEREREAEHLLKEIVTENFPNLETNMDNQVHTDERSKMIFSPKRISLTNQTLKKERERDSFESSKRKKREIIEKEASIRLLADFLAENLQGRRCGMGLPRQKRADGIHPDWNCFKRNLKGSSSY